MRLADFDFDLPAESIARWPVAERSASRLLVLRQGFGPTHHRFACIGEHLRPGDVLVLNDTKVIPARLRGHKDSGGRVEILLVSAGEGLGEADSPTSQQWLALFRSSKPLREGAVVRIGEDLVAHLVERLPDGMGRFLLESSGGVRQAVEVLGEVPLPPYLEREATREDRERYQTVYARHEGAVAAPTAGLHFTPELLAGLEEQGIEVVSVTLHVGPGTFLPVRAEIIEEHRMHAESFVVPEATAVAVNSAREEGRTVVAVGTTVVRALEASAAAGRVAPGAGRTDLFIYPGYRFRVVDAMITNFHLPRSSLLMLVSALAGREALLAAYAEAIREGYRFYSYGDAMLVR